MSDVLKPLTWMGASRRGFSAFPEAVKSEMGYGLFQAQQGFRHRKAKTLTGFGSAGVVEIVSEYRGDAFRTVYTVRFASSVYVLHAFQKKSKTGVATPQSEINLVRQRLREAEQLEQGSRS
jgi:phage-related protein